MKKFISLLCFLLALTVWAKGPKLVFSEQAVFKIEDKIFLLSDIVKFGKSLSLFRCLNPNALILQTIELDKKNQEIIPDFAVLGEAYLMEDGIYLQRVLKLMKLNVFMGKQSVELDKNSLTNFKSEKCGTTLGSFETWGKELKELFLLEGFWSDRFSANSYKLTDREIDEIKAKNPKDIKPAVLKKVLESERERLGLSSAQALVKTVDKQIPHELFY